MSPRRRPVAGHAVASIDDYPVRCWPEQPRDGGLLGEPGRSAEAPNDGWFHTGDGGTIDDDDYVTIADRKKDVIISGGENVSSIEVEDAVFSHPTVARSP